ncbi:hypothetical protein SAMN04489727_5811 [Amycolatopsis tolypomycina]|uniref:Uncharacterized protein n=1 Tax=Amycolatopsis tolypomycina TaxID=208445 RepID=A0A1H4WX30_9PSEU|nr:hypothetical protein [Amycolatopsis tolypomycina]SEC97171.1 hypothetical protein SAMN04489727_5811 [Amycolatopsis tolypomycina]
MAFTVRADDDTATVGGGVLVAVGLVVAFFGWWSWWAVVGLGVAAVGALWLTVARRDE